MNRWSIVGAFGLSIWAVPAATQEQGRPKTPAGGRDEIIVTGLRERETYIAENATVAKIDAPLRDIPQTIDVIPSAIIRDQRALSIQDALKNVPGIGLSNGDGQRDQVTIRGFTAISDQFVDGFRDDALYFRDLSNVERIEVVKGPAAVLYGRGSSGGLINRVTRKPGLDIAELTATYGSFNSKRAEFDIGRANADASVAFRVTGARERSDSFRAQQFLDREALAPSLAVKAGRNTDILVQADYLRDSRVTDFGIPAYLGRPVRVDRSTYYGAANARKADVSRSEVFSQTVTLNHRFGDDLSFRNGFRHYRYTLARRNTLPGAVLPVTPARAQPQVSLTRSNFFRNEDGWSNQAELTQSLRLGATAHRLLYGFEIARQVKDQLLYSKAGVAIVDLFRPVLPVLPVDLGGAPVSNNTGIFDTKAVYVQDLMDFGGGFKALLGLRHDWFDQRTVQRLALPSVGRKDREWSPRIGLVFQPDQAQSYYASFSKSFQPSGESFSIAANNADIAPEKTTNKEIGAKYTLLGGQLNATLSLFELKRTGIKSASPAAPTILIPIGTQRTRGFEATAALDLLSGWRAIAGYSYLDARIVQSLAFDAGQPVLGKRATITPKHAANLFVTKSFGDEFGFGIGGNYVSDRFANPGNTVILPGYITADALAWYQLGAARLQLNGYNLFDRDYIVSGHGTAPNLNLPGAPRTVLFTARLSL